MEVKREVICADACEWLDKRCLENLLLPGSVFTSLPDISEITKLFAGLSDDERIRQYESWFIHQASQIMSLLTKGEYAIFLQSDVRVQQKTSDKHILKWIDKSYLCTSAAYKSNCNLLWHKLVYMGDIDARSAGRPGYSHLLCYGKDDASYNSGDFATPDIFDRGEMLWPKGIGIDCCFMGVVFLAHVGKTKVIVDPFCGVGTVLAMANALGVSSLGVEISSKRCHKARTLQLNDIIGVLSRLSPGRMSVLGLPKHCQPKLVVHLTTENAKLVNGDSHDDDDDDGESDNDNDEDRIKNELSNNNNNNIRNRTKNDDNKPVDTKKQFLLFNNNNNNDSNNDGDAIKKDKNKKKKQGIKEKATTTFLMEKMQGPTLFDHRLLFLCCWISCCVSFIIIVLTIVDPTSLVFIRSSGIEKLNKIFSSSS